MLKNHKIVKLGGKCVPSREKNQIYHLPVRELVVRSDYQFAAPPKLLTSKCMQPNGPGRCWPGPGTGSVTSLAPTKLKLRAGGAWAGG